MACFFSVPLFFFIFATILYKQAIQLQDEFAKSLISDEPGSVNFEQTADAKISTDDTDDPANNDMNDDLPFEHARNEWELQK